MPADPDGSRAAPRPGDDLADGRAETAAERADRNWSDVLQELRVLQTGTQILTGFLLALAFQPAFADLSSGQQALYLCLIVLSAISAIMALSPVAVHRVLFQRQVKPTVVRVGHLALLTSLFAVSLLLVGVVAFVFDVVVSQRAAWIAGGALAFVILVSWVIVPALLRRERGAKA